jgi:alpha-glucosidase (family GH31 glycosyl hydrolase)
MSTAAAGAIAGLLAVLALALVPAKGAADATAIKFRTGTGVVVVERAPLRIMVRAVSGGSGVSTLRRSLNAGGVRYSSFGFALDPVFELEPPSLDGPEGDLAGQPETVVDRYSATRVLSAKAGAKSVRIVAATNDPAGRKVRIEVRRGRAGTADIRASVFPSAGVSAVSASFGSKAGESFHGFGGRREGTDLRGSDIRSWVLDYRYPDPTTAYYAPFPGFISSRGYGVLLGGSLISRWRMASDTPTAWRVSRPGASLPLTVATGGTRAAMKAISAITGRHRVPPDWSTGPMLSRTIGIISDAGGQYRTRVEADLDRIEQGDLPVSSYAFEGWGPLPREFVTGSISRLNQIGIRAVLYLRSFVSNDVAGTEQPGAFEQAVDQGLVAENAAGEPYLVPSPFPGAQAAVIDFTDPAARSWWRNRIWDLLDTGADGFMNDFGEQVEPDMRFDDGSTGLAMHNRYPVLQAKITRQAVNQWQRLNPGREVFFFQRAGFSGSPGSSAFENAQFPGDETVDWAVDTGLPSIVPDMLNRAVMGAPGFTTDIGGYAQFRKEAPILPATSGELFTRWSQAAALTPFFRVHNSGLNGARMPWDFGPSELQSWKEMADLHNRARPLIKRLWRVFLRTGVPMTRPLWLVDPGTARTARADDQWLLGPDLLVAPVMEQGAVSRPVWFPEGCWRLHGEGAAIRGGRESAVEAPLDSLPWFTRCGTSPLGS